MSYNNDAKNCQKNAPVLITVKDRARLYTDLIRNFNLKSTNDLKKDTDALIDCINKHTQSNAVVPEEFYQHDIRTFLQVIHFVAQRDLAEMLGMGITPLELTIRLMRSLGAKDEQFPFKEEEKEEKEEEEDPIKVMRVEVRSKEELRDLLNKLSEIFGE